jgi:hypothetical protein
MIINNLTKKIVEVIHDLIIFILIIITSLTLLFAFVKESLPFDVEIKGIHLGEYKDENISKK